MTRDEEFEQLRPLLFSIAYRILGSVAEAEDAVQDTWLRWQGTTTVPTSVKSFLSALVTRVAIDVLRSARVRREAYVGPWMPEPLLADPYEDPERSAELADSLSMAALLLLERLLPLERAVFVLREVLAADVYMVGDNGGKAPLIAQEAYGAATVAALIGPLGARFDRIGVRLEPHDLNGQPGAILRAPDGKVLSTLMLDVADGRIQTIRAVVNPDKLAHVGPVADIWAVRRAAEEAASNPPDLSAAP